MPIRNRHKIGDYLMLDDESGLVHYRSEMRQIWNGTWRHERNYETRQPQEFVRARTDPKALLDVRPEPATSAACLFTSPTIGCTNVLTKVGPGTSFAGIGDMIIPSVDNIELETGNCDTLLTEDGQNIVGETIDTNDNCAEFFIYSAEQSKSG